MKASELMIGDLVYSKLLKRAWVIRPSDVRRMFDEQHDVFDEDGCFKYIEPVPLTEEILKENGWEKNDPNWPSVLRKSYKKYNHSFTLSCWMQKGKWDMYIHDNGNVELNRFRPSCVHELQHALRLMGLAEEADRFEPFEQGKEVEK